MSVGIVDPAVRTLGAALASEVTQDSRPSSATAPIVIGLTQTGRKLKSITCDRCHVEIQSFKPKDLSDHVVSCPGRCRQCREKSIACERARSDSKSCKGCDGEICQDLSHSSRLEVGLTKTFERCRVAKPYSTLSGRALGPNGCVPCQEKGLQCGDFSHEGGRVVRGSTRAPKRK